MNLLLLREEELSKRSDGGAPIILLSGERARHLREVLRVQPGSRVRVGVVNGGVGEGEVVAVSDGTVELAIGSLAAQRFERPFALILALPRPIMLKRILEHTASCGFRSLTLIGTARVEKSYFSTPLLDPQKLRYHLERGAEQGGLTVLPEVQVIPRFHEFLKSFDSVRAPETFGAHLKLIADPSAESALSRAVQLSEVASGEEIIMAVGPEGGWWEAEVRALRDRGFKPFHLGRFLLRVEVAVSVLWGQLSLLRELARDASTGKGFSSSRSSNG